MELTLEELDATDEQAVDEVLEVLRSAHAIDRPTDPTFTPSIERGRMVHPDPYELSRFTLLRTGGLLAGVLDLSLPQAADRGTAFVGIVVHPHARRRGLGRALWQHALAECRGRGRGLVVASTFDGSPGDRFAATLGAQPVLREVRRLLVLDTSGRARIAAAQGQVPPGYELHSWTPPTNPRLAGQLADLTGHLDVGRILAREHVNARRGIRTYSTAAVDVEGRPIGCTTLAVCVDDRTHAWQKGTIVHPEHRGRGLGLLMKAANLRQTKAANPRLRTVLTWNAESNRHMIAVNTALGFEVHDRRTQWQVEV